MCYLAENVLYWHKMIFDPSLRSLEMFPGLTNCFKCLTIFFVYVCRENAVSPFPTFLLLLFPRRIFVIRYHTATSTSYFSICVFKNEVFLTPTKVPIKNVFLMTSFPPIKAQAKKSMTLIVIDVY